MTVAPECSCALAAGVPRRRGGAGGVATRRAGVTRGRVRLGAGPPGNAGPVRGAARVAARRRLFAGRQRHAAHRALSPVCAAARRSGADRLRGAAAPPGRFPGIRQTRFTGRISIRVLGLGLELPSGEVPTSWAGAHERGVALLLQCSQLHARDGSGKTGCGCTLGSPAACIGRHALDWGPFWWVTAPAVSAA
jgi:hypothetical protein